MNDNDMILVIDDELGIREGCRRVLEPQGFLVETCATFQEGQRKIKENDFDLVLLDVMMPDGRGIDLLEKIKAKDPDIVSVIITGYATVELAVEAIKRGAYDFISKPFSSDLLIMTVNQGLEKRKLLRETKRLQSIEREAEELARAKEEAQRLGEFKSTFMLMVAHELRSPVGGAQSLVRTLLKGLAGELTEQQKELLGRVNQRMSFLLELINDLLTLAASKSIEPDAPLDNIAVQPVIQNVLERLSDEVRAKKLDLKYQAPEQVLQVMATEDGLEKIFGNLIGNAIKYTHEGGKVDVNVVKEDSHVRISVSDTGIGIPAQALPHIGEEFFRAKNAHKTGIAGTGLGVSIIKQFTERFGGQVGVQSEEGKGTTFTVTFPLK